MSLMPVFFLALLLALGAANFADIVKSCTKYKKDIFEQQVAYSFLFPGAPIEYKTLDNCHSYTPLIVGGIPAEPKEFPHAARLGVRATTPRNHINWFCGGTLIHERFVLTAAHCLEAELGEVDIVRLGELDFDTESDDAAPKDYEVAEYTVHPNYTDPELYNDIGLIKLAEPVKFDVYKHPACLPFSDGRNDATYIAVGWGSTSDAMKPSPKLLKVQLDRYADTICNQVVGIRDDYPRGYESISQMCVGSDKPMDTCNGDSGGPILVYHKDYPCMYHVMGITSTGISCGAPKIPSIYTRVHYYLDWIEKIITKN